MSQPLLQPTRRKTYFHRFRRPAAVAGIVAVITTLRMILPAQSACAASSSPAGQLVVPSAQEMTRSLINLTGQYQHAAPAVRGALLAEIIDLAETRRQLLAALVEDEPATVLQAALPADVRAEVPPAAQGYIEEATEVAGTLDVSVEDRPTTSRVHYVLTTNDGRRRALSFASHPPSLLSGSHVRVRGVQVNDTLALASGSAPDVNAVSLAVPNTFGAQNTLVLLVNFQDNAAQPYTLGSAQSVVFTATSNFYLEQSYQQTWLVGDVFGWFTIPMSTSACDTATLATLANSAAIAAGVNLSAYTHYVYAFPQNACTWSGLGSVGGNPSQAFINGGFGLQVVAHELGHNLGLYHAHGLDCGSATLGSSCAVIEYGDKFDVMGGSPGHFGAFQKERLGWLNYGSSPPIRIVQASGTYALDPYESMGSSQKALKILKSTDPTTGARTWYYVEYRQALGFDAFLSGNTNALYGVVVHIGTDADANTSELLDMAPTLASWSAPALDVWQTFYDTDAGVGISPVSTTSAGASVSVSLGAPPAPVPCVRAMPLLTVWPASQTVPYGMTVNYSLSVANYDNSGCGPSSFALQAAVPGGWTASLASPVLTISPGGSASTTLQVTAPFFTTAGSYVVGATASNASAPAFGASVSAAYSIGSSAPAATATSTAMPTSQPTPTFTKASVPTATSSPSATLVFTPTATPSAASTPTSAPIALTVAVATDRANYLRGQLVSITASVSSGGTPVSNASVSFTVTKSNGAVVGQTTTTAANGSATYQLRLKKQDPIGTYQVRASAKLNGAVGSAATTFTVQ